MKKFLERLLGRPADSREGRGREKIADENQVKPFLENGRRLYAIGDIHGRLAELWWAGDPFELRCGVGAGADNAALGIAA